MDKAQLESSMRINSEQTQGLNKSIECLVDQKIFNFENPETKEIYRNYFMFGYFKDNLGYILNDAKNKILIGVDFGEYESSKKAVDIIENITDSKLKYILTTHSHWDHSGGNGKWKENKKDGITIISGKTTGDSVPFTDLGLDDDQELKFGNINIKCVFTPGHIKSHVCYLVSDDDIPGQNFVFTGDTLFSAGCGRVFTGTHEEMYESLSKLKALPLNSMIFCGHEYTAKNLEFSLSLDSNNENIKNKLEQVKKLNEQNKYSMGSMLKDELLYNPFLRCQEDFFRNKFSLDNPVDIFKKIRVMKDKF